MPVWLQIAVGVVAILGFVISLYLAWLRFEERQAKADLQVSMDWRVGGGDMVTLLIVVENQCILDRCLGVFYSAYREEQRDRVDTFVSSSRR